MFDRLRVVTEFRFSGAFVIAALACVGMRPASAYGPEGHLIAGIAAEPYLCERAAAEVRALGEGENLGELGLWADRIRSNADYAESAPWHYMNIATGAALADFEHPPEGDVLWAIERFTQRLADARLDRAERSEALRFLVHFIVDIHQPLHVGLAEDRGGNSIEIRYRRENTNLHRFWDTHVLEWSGLSLGEYVAEIEAGFDRRGNTVSLDPVVWARESLVLRGRVYEFGRPGRELGRRYLDFADATTRDRLALAAQRLAGTLNRIFC